MTNLDQIQAERYPGPNGPRTGAAHATRYLALLTTPLWAQLIFISPRWPDIAQAFMHVGQTSWASAVGLLTIAAILKAVPTFFIGAIVVTCLFQAGYDVRRWPGLTPWVIGILWRALCNT